MAFVKCLKNLDVNLLSLATSSKAHFRFVPWGRRKEEEENLTPEQKKSLKYLLVDETTEEKLDSYDVQAEMDSIRARSLLRHRYRYDPPENIHHIVKQVISTNGLEKNENWKLHSLDSSVKDKILLQLGTQLNLFVPNSKLHKIKTVGDLLEFYSTPISNLPKYSQMARDESLPENLAIREQPVRFHPNDTHAPHGGVTAFPGSGGQVLGLRNKRLYRQFNPKKEWFEFEEQNFSYERVDKDMPWDPDMARRMDREVNKKFTVKSLKLRKI